MTNLNKGGNMIVNDSVLHEPVFVRPIKTKDVAEYMGLSEQSVLRKVRMGLIPAKRVGNQYFYDPRKIAELCGIPYGS